MRILYYIPALYNSGGLERIITFKANYLVNQFGYDVTILTSEQQAKKPYYALSERVNHIDLGVVFDTNSYSSKLIKFLKYPYKYYIFKRRFSIILYKLRPDITISTLRRELYFINSLHDGSVKVGEFHVTRHSYHAEAIRERGVFARVIKECWRRYFVHKVSRLSKIVLLTNAEVLNWPELTNTAVIHNPLTIFPEKFSDCSSHEVIAVGRYVYIKGLDLLINAWEIVQDKHQGWNLRIYGEGKQEILMKQISGLHLEESCHLNQPVSNISDKFAESSIFVLSSRFEGFGMVICEAMACGVPPVSFDCPCGPKDIINDGEDGLLVENGNIEELAHKICYLIENENIRKQMGSQARINVERFKAEKIMNQWNELFRSLLIFAPHKL